jgi:hypothetical protein
MIGYHGEEPSAIVDAYNVVGAAPWLTQALAECAGVSAQSVSELRSVLEHVLGIGRHQ